MPPLAFTFAKSAAPAGCGRTETSASLAAAFLRSRKPCAECGDARALKSSTAHAPPTVLRLTDTERAGCGPAGSDGGTRRAADTRGGSCRLSLSLTIIYFISNDDANQTNKSILYPVSQESVNGERLSCVAARPTATRHVSHVTISVWGLKANPAGAVLLLLTIAVHYTRLMFYLQSVLESKSLRFGPSAFVLSEPVVKTRALCNGKLSRYRYNT
ncbi:hypothetical protein EVAR_18636_1 [Eumeta japonica]|uniref:Uncharacterized protein n=1 Tax=Eumeta variegata TaxID=151549 RepID=A0A4C1U6K5_EUMVA|nr:hypothetical protein EVAR_18636_1 [Eumeta japonica]